MPGSSQWRQSHASQLDALMQRVIRQTGERGLAQEAVQAAENALIDLYHQAMVNSGGDRSAALRAVEHHTESVFELAGLVPQIVGDDPESASTAIRQAQRVLHRLGHEDPTFMYPWLRANVDSDRVLRGAGLDPQRVRHVDSPWAYADLEGLMGMVHQMLAEYRDRDGQRLSQGQIEGYMDQAWAYAHHHGVGAQYVPPAPPNAESEPAETLRVQDLHIPRRV